MYRSCIYRMSTKEKRSIWLPFLISLFIMILLFGCFMQPHYSSDSYANLHNIDVAVHIRNGRIISAIVQKTMNLIRFNPVQHQSLTIAVSLCVLALCITLIYLEIRPNLKGKLTAEILVLLSLQLVFANVFFSEWLMYVESATIICIVGPLLLSVSIVLAGREITWKRITVSFLLLLAALNIYQLYIEFYLTLSLLIVYTRAEGLLTKHTLGHSAVIALVALLACVITIAIQSTLPQLFGIVAGDRTAVFDLEKLLGNLKVISRAWKPVSLNAYGLLPNAVFPVVWVILFTLMLREHFRCHNFGNRILYSLIAIGTIALLTYAPHIISSVVWMAPRTIVGTFHVPMYMAVSIGVTQASIPEQKNRILKMTITVVLAFLMINAYATNGVLTNAIANNRMDQYCANEIQVRIDQYQSETGIVVNKLGICNDQSPVYRYLGVKYVTHDLNIRAMNVEWGSTNLINYYCGKNYENVSIPAEVYETYFSGKNWDFLNLDEQAVFIGDTLYLAMY